MNRSTRISVLVLTVLFSGCATQHHSTADLASGTNPPKSKSLRSDPEPESLLQVGRYSQIKAAPTQAQIDLLRVMVSVTLPNEVITVRQAVEHILSRSGYRLTESGEQTEAVSGLLGKPLPRVHRHLGPMPLEESLRTLAGPVFDLMVDPVHRTVSYQLKGGFEPTSKYTEEESHE